MKVLNSITKFFVSVILMTSLLLMFDIYHLFWWVENKLVDKFVLHFILSDNADVDYITSILKTNFKNLEFKEISFITKQQVYDEVKQKDELAVVLNVLKQNPFPDVIRIRIKNYSKKEFENLLSVTSSIPYVKQSLFDYNVKSYLDRIKELESLIKLGCKIVLFVIILVIIFSFLNIKNLKINLFLTLLFSVVYVFVVLINKKFVDLITATEIVKFDLLSVVLFIIFYLFCVFPNLGVE